MESNLEGKYKTWMITINTLESGYLPDEKDLIIFFENECQDYVFQKECGDETERVHYQCAVKFRSRKRKSTVIKSLQKSFPEGFSAFQLERMFGTFAESIDYCTKSDTRIGIPVSSLPLYSGADVDFLVNRDRRYPWQIDLLEEISVPGHLRIKAAHDRQITWITDKQGNSGKSKFVKYVYLHYRNTIKIAFGTATQMRASMIDAGPRSLYMIDIPRTLGNDDDIRAVYSLIEDLKNGFVVSSMYGKNRQLVMNPPHIIVFTNRECPFDVLSKDRWRDYYITPEKLLIKGDLYRWNWVSGEKKL